MKQFKEMNDSQLCNAIKEKNEKEKNEKAFEVLHKRYQNIVAESVYKNITKGGFHKQLSVSYISAMEDLQSQAWLEIYNQLRTNFNFNTTAQLKVYLYRIARSETCKFMRNRIALRQQAGTDSNLQFPRFDTEYKKNKDAFMSVEYINEDDHLIDKVLSELVNKLTEKENKVLDMQLSGISQKDIATKLSVDVRTIYNMRKKIIDKAKRVVQEIVGNQEVGLLATIESLTS